LDGKELRLPDHAGERLDSALSAALEISRSRVQESMRQGLIRVGGIAVGKSYRLIGNEIIEVLPFPENSYRMEAQPIPLRIVFQDQDIAVVSKQPGLVVHPAAGHHDGTLVNALLYALPDLGKVGEEVRPGIVHRLDRDTSGLMVVAKHEDALVRLQAMVKRREVKRWYLALLHGMPPSVSGTIDAPVGRDQRDRKKMAVTGEGKPAITHFKLLESLPGYSLVEVELVTGRTHQIRVHFSHIGHPVAGDRVYGRFGEKDRLPGLARQFLHAWRLDFDHPLKNKPLSFTDPLPDDLAEVLEYLGGTSPL
jgi:23S rRNA pseudouridine1911/1915/1917 synthase